MSAAEGKEPRRTPRGHIAGEDDGTEQVWRLAEGTPLALHWTCRRRHGPRPSWHHHRHRGQPVPPAQLRAIHLSYAGFDGRAHTGEIIVNAAVVGQVIEVFGI